MSTESKLDGMAEDMVSDLINAKQEIMHDEDGTRGLFSRDRRKTALPQYDEEPEKREEWIEENQEKYIYNFELIPGVPMLKDLPKEEEFTAEYLVRRGLTFVSKLFKNEQLLKIKGILDPFDKVDSYAELFQALPVPTSIQWWRSDEAFAEQRVAGPNPMMIKGVTSWDEMPFPITDKDKLVPGKNETFAAVMDRGGFYKVDYDHLGFIQGVKDEKFTPAPKLLLMWDIGNENAMLKSLMGYKKSGQLMPVAIRIREDLPVLWQAEADEDDWLIAKWCVQIADGNDHELRAHWTLTHMVMEPFAIATQRQLAENHPLGVLLRPHFRFMVYNNNEAVLKLLSKGGWIEQLMGGTLEESIQIATDAYAKWTLQGQSFPTELKNRKVDDTEKLPHFPYRDDGMMLWAAIKLYVKKYLRIYYRKRQDLENDQELQAWAQELADKNRGRVVGMPEKIDNIKELTEIITTLIFTCSAQHCAVNFTQYDYMSTVLNMPLGAYCPVVLGSERKDFGKYAMEFLPPSHRATLQQKVATLLSSFHYDVLGEYKKKDFDDPEALAVIEDFKEDLKMIEKKITVTNIERDFPYKYLLPSEILNSISI